MKAVSQFSDPKAVGVTITLAGTIGEFEELAADLSKSEVPFYRVQALLDTIRDASHKMRATVFADELPEQAK